MKDHSFNNHHRSTASGIHSVWALLRSGRRGILYIVFLLASSTSLFAAAPLTLAWNTNPESDIAGYRVRYGTTSGTYTVTKEAGNSTTTTIPDLVPGVRYFITVSAFNNAGLESTASAEITTVYEPDSDSDGLPDSWETAHGIAGNPTAGGSTGDPDQDGIPNLVEYALNLNPVLPQGTSPTPNTIQVNPADGKRYLTLTYHRRINAPGFVYTVEATSNFVQWSSAPTQVEQVGTPIMDANGITETVTVRIKPALEDSASPTSSARLRISR